MDQREVDKETLYVYAVDVSCSMRLASNGSALWGQARIVNALELVKADLGEKLRAAEKAKQSGKPKRTLISIVTFTHTAETQVGIKELDEDSSKEALAVLDSLRAARLPAGSDIACAWKFCLKQIVEHQDLALRKDVHSKGVIQLHSDGGHNVNRELADDCKGLVKELKEHGQLVYSVLLSYGRETDRTHNEQTAEEYGMHHVQVDETNQSEAIAQLHQTEAQEKRKWRQQMASVLGINITSGERKTLAAIRKEKGQNMGA